MAGSKLLSTAGSGVYKCTACDTLSVHIKGHIKEPCFECGSNCNWVVKNLTANNLFDNNQKSSLS